MPTSFSRPLDTLLYHQFLKGDTSLCDTGAVRSEPLVSHNDASSSPLPSFHWDLQITCKSMFPAFQYISQKLSLQGLSIALIISDHGPCVVPVWILPKKSQVILTRIVRKACKKFPNGPSWMTALAALSNRKDLPRVFESYQPDSYVVRQSVVQHKVVFSTEGLTLLSIDHVYTFKWLLCTFSKKDWASYSRDTCISSCVHLLSRIHNNYAGKSVLKEHIATVYKEIEFSEETLDEVYSAYNANYCTASIYEVAFEPEYAVPFDTIRADWNSPAPAMQAATNVESESSDSEKLISPIADVDLSTLYSWKIEDASRTTSQEIHNPLPITYPEISKPSEANFLENHPIVTQPIEPRTLEIEESDEHNSIWDFLDEWDYEACPSPLQISKDAKAPQNQYLEIADSPIGDYNIDHLESPSRFIECWSTLVPSALCSKCKDMIDTSQRVTLH